VKEVTRIESTGIKRCDGDYLALERLKRGVGVEHTGKLRETALYMYGRDVGDLTCSWP
jgi:hypothetical protein